MSMFADVHSVHRGIPAVRHASTRDAVHENTNIINKIGRCQTRSGHVRSG